jgi:carbon monoxide dehydrogenase subunit G
MEINGSQIIAAKRELVWSSLNDPDTLKQCLPGCESVEKISDDLYKIVLVAVVGPMRIRFKGSLQMSEAKPPISCHMIFEGQGGVAGFGKGTANVTLNEVPDGTELVYSANAQVGGKLAQVGSRLIDGVAKKITDDFFKEFRKSLMSPSPESVMDDKKLTTMSHVKNPIYAGGSSPLVQSSSQQMVPAWWLIIAVILGAGVAIVSAHLIQ